NRIRPERSSPPLLPLGGGPLLLYPSSAEPGSRPRPETRGDPPMPDSTVHFSVVERFLRYVKFDTQSSETSQTYPSTAKQLDLLNHLVDELKAIGLADAAIDEHGYVMATIPATTRKQDVPVIGFIAHVDTSPEMPGADVKPIVHRAYDGRDLVLPDDPAAVLRLADNPDLRDQIGHDIV